METAHSLTAYLMSKANRLGEQMNDVVSRIVIVGGGSAGWLTAAVIAAEHVNSDLGIQVTLIESPDINSIGVGEGTWPSMRATLAKIGLSETEFFRECDASFKQGSKFKGWLNGSDADAYYHPFTLPDKYREINLAKYWLKYRDKVSFADAVCVQSHLCERGLAPKQITAPEYSFAANYGYHLDAGKFSALLHKHCVEILGVKYISDSVTCINAAENGDIASLSLQVGGVISGDLFIDCSGFASILLGGYYKIPFISKKHILFNDRALAIQTPYPDPNSPISSQTTSIAQEAGWIWDIGLPSRRGVGHVFSSAHIGDDDAEITLRKYIEQDVGKKIAEELPVRKIKINPGHREIFWHKNCVAVGMAAGFIEPLEASALVLIELSAAMISEQLPATRQIMDLSAKRFNEKFHYRWGKIIDFLKLHYVLTQRQEKYWRDNCESKTLPEGLRELLELWRYRTPWYYDELQIDEMFPSASFQYVLYGMQFSPDVIPPREKVKATEVMRAEELFSENFQLTQRLLTVLPTNRDLIEKIKKHGLQKI